MIALSSPRLRVVFGDVERPDDWVSVDVQTIGRDMMMAEELLARNGLGKMADVPIAGSAAAAYYALKRTGKRPGDWEAFQSEYLDIQAVDDGELADPTRKGRGNGLPPP